MEKNPLDFNRCRHGPFLIGCQSKQEGMGIDNRFRRKRLAPDVNNIPAFLESLTGLP